MSYAPASLTSLGAYWTAQGGANLGIVGNAAHTYGYHLGRDRIYGAGGQGDSDYSVQLPADRAGLTDAAAAIDLGAGTLDLRDFTAWLLAECVGRGLGTEMIREVIGSTDGTTVVGWTITAPDQLVPGYGDQSHTWHTHVSFLRSTQEQDKTALFARYFAGPPAPPEDHTVTITNVTNPGGTIVTIAGAQGMALNGSAAAYAGGLSFPVLFLGAWNGRMSYSVAGPDGSLIGFADDQCNWRAAGATITLGPGLYEVR